MTISEKKIILKSYAETEGRIRDLREQKRDFLLRFGSSANGIPGGTVNGTKTEKAVEHIENILYKLSQEEENLLAIEYRIVRAISDLNDVRQRRVLQMKYIGKGVRYKQRWGFGRIAREMNYSERWIKEIHYNALRNLKL